MNTQPKIVITLQQKECQEICGLVLKVDIRKFTFQGDYLAKLLPLKGTEKRLHPCAPPSPTSTRQHSCHFDSWSIHSDP